jgi:hypothetical protein
MDTGIWSLAMNKINPIHIIALLFVICAFFIFKTNNSKDELNQLNDDYKKRVVIATELKELVKAYTNKRTVENLLRGLSVDKDMKKSSVILSSKSMDKKDLDKIMNKILNATCNITSLNIKKIDEKFVAFEVEIKW